MFGKRSTDRTNGNGVLWIVYCWSLCYFIVLISAPPPKRKGNYVTEAPIHEEDADENNLEYKRYLNEVVSQLESHGEFKKKLDSMSAKDMQSGKIADELHLLPEDIRSRLHEIKRRELERVRQMRMDEAEKHGLESVKTGVDHVDHGNLETFESEDLRKLIKKTAKDLDDMDKERRRRFKEYEMQKRLEEKHKMENMTEEERKKVQAEHQQDVQKHKDHPKLHEPGSKDQLEDVWENVDDLEREQYDPKTFFKLHDINDDGYLDDEEVDSLMRLEIEKMYNASNPEDDMTEAFEEMNRMREHMMDEMDTDKDGYISLQEFMDKEDEVDDGWKGLDEDDDVFSSQELDEYEKESPGEKGGTPGAIIKKLMS